MLFSHPQVAEILSSSFECAWESVRPVPKVRIDFGEGRVLERTLHGNIATYFCTSEGEVYDLLPGLVDATEFVRRLDQAIRLHRAGFAHPAPDSSHQMGRQTVMEWHRALAQPMEGNEIPDGDPVPIIDLTKMRVERLIDEALMPLASEDRESLRRDTLHNRRHRYPLASRLLIERPFARPADITNEVYLSVLDVDLADPWLGLAPDVLGGESGRHQ